ncbi:SDR family oxidoreductase, partial [Streptomyces mirabilis]
ALAADPDRAALWNGKSASSAELARTYGVRDVDGSRPDAWAYFEAVVHGGKDTPVDEYR